jgi:hypothetical protein
MSPTRFVTSVVLAGALASAPVFAQEGQRRRQASGQRAEQGENRGSAERRAVPRGTARQAEADRAPAAARPPEVPQQAQAQRRADVQPQVARQGEAQQFQGDRRYNAGRSYDNHQYEARAVPRPYYRGYGYGYGYGRPVVVPRVIYPALVTVVPYQPYVYRPSLSLGVFYGSGGAYPYGYTPRGYYDPIPGHFYGGLRITGAPREAQVFADGYYVGIVNDFDGVFQHLNLEAGPHHIEIQEPGLEPVAFDMIVQAGRTMTYHAEMAAY